MQNIIDCCSKENLQKFEKQQQKIKMRNSKFCSCDSTMQKPFYRNVINKFFDIEHCANCGKCIGTWR